VVISAPRRLGFALLLERFDTLTNCLENRLVNFLSRDIAMPEADGGELAARIESDPTSHRTPVVFLTALVTKAEAKSALPDPRTSTFLAKPISIPDLIAALNEICLREMITLVTDS